MDATLEHSSGSPLRRFLRWWFDFEAAMDLTQSDVLALRLSNLEPRLKRLEGVQAPEKAETENSESRTMKPTGE